MYYDHFAKHKNTHIGEAFVQRLFKTLSQWGLQGLPENPRVLEIGIGRGVFAAHLHSQSNGKMRYTGIEPNQALCELARKEGLAAIPCMVPPFPAQLTRASFDLIVMSHVLEHFRDHIQALEVLAQIHELLAPGGRFLLFYPDYLDYGTDFFDVDYSHSFILTQSRVENLITDSGFAIQKQAGFRACFYRCPLLTWGISKGVDLIAGLLLKITHKRVFFKAKITFKCNRLLIAQKK